MVARKLVCILVLLEIVGKHDCISVMILEYAAGRVCSIDVYRLIIFVKVTDVICDKIYT